jgi:hypothetical protein
MRHRSSQSTHAGSTPALGTNFPGSGSAPPTRRPVLPGVAGLRREPPCERGRQMVRLTDKPAEQAREVALKVRVRCRTLKISIISEPGESILSAETQDL